jgi:Sec23/Sec24 trunk domain
MFCLQSFVRLLCHNVYIMMNLLLLFQSQIGGKLLVFQSNLPSIGVGRLRLRGDDVRAYGTDKEYNLRIPEDPFYKQMAAEFTKNQISVDIFAFSNKYCDIASLGECSFICLFIFLKRNSKASSLQC